MSQRNTRPKNAEHKAVLALQLGLLARKPPPEIQSAGVIATREWVAKRRAVMSVLKSKRCSVPALQAALELLSAGGGDDRCTLH